LTNKLHFSVAMSRCYATVAKLDTAVIILWTALMLGYCYSKRTIEP